MDDDSIRKSYRAPSKLFFKNSLALSYYFLMLDPDFCRSYKYFDTVRNIRRAEWWPNNAADVVCESSYCICFSIQHLVISVHLWIDRLLIILFLSRIWFSWINKNSWIGLILIKTDLWWDNYYFSREGLFVYVTCQVS